MTKSKVIATPQHFFHKWLGSSFRPQNYYYFQDFQGLELFDSHLVNWLNMVNVKYMVMFLRVSLCQYTEKKTYERELRYYRRLFLLQYYKNYLQLIFLCCLLHDKQFWSYSTLLLLRTSCFLTGCLYKQCAYSLEVSFMSFLL